jgi:hypothetical protein
MSGDLPWGMGLRQNALAAGVPVCVVPFGPDQPEVAWRVELARAGIRLPASRLRPDRLREAVPKAIGCKAGAERIAAAFAATGPRAAPMRSRSCSRLRRAGGGRRCETIAGTRRRLTSAGLLGALEQSSSGPFR